MYRKLWDKDVEARIRKEAKNLDPQTPPEEVIRCTSCVMTNQRPRIVFDEEGVCSACRYHERQENKIDWETRGEEFCNLLDEHRGRYMGGSLVPNGARPYDVIVPSSGGKDSSFVAITLRDLGMTPLAACWCPHIYTDIGWKNMQSFIHSGFDAVTAQPNGLLHRKLSRLALEFYGDPFLPFIYGQLCWGFHVAVQNNVELVFFGENGEAMYGGDPSAADKPCWDESDWERVYMKGATFDRLMDLGVELGAISLEERERACPFYTMPEVSQRPQFYWMSYFKPWYPQANYYAAVQQTGFECNEERSPATYSKYASLDDKLDSLHYRLGYLKFGIGRATSDAAHEVRDGELEREEALALIGKYDHLPPWEESPHYEECMEYLGIDHEWYLEIESRFLAR